MKDLLYLVNDQQVLGLLLDHHRPTRGLPYALNPIKVIWIYIIRFCQGVRYRTLLQYLIHKRGLTNLTRTNDHLYLPAWLFYAPKHDVKLFSLECHNAQNRITNFSNVNNKFLKSGAKLHKIFDIHKDLT